MNEVSAGRDQQTRVVAEDGRGTLYCNSFAISSMPHRQRGSGGRRGVQNRRILRLQDADGDETIIIAREDDDIRSVATTTESAQPAGDVKADVSGHDRLSRVVSSTK